MALQINSSFQLFRTTYWTRLAEKKTVKEIRDVDSFDNIAMSTSDLNESSVENGTNKIPGTSNNHTVEHSGLKKFRDPNLDRNQKEDEGENNG